MNSSFWLKWGVVSAMGSADWVGEGFNLIGGFFVSEGNAVFIVCPDELWKPSESHLIDIFAPQRGEGTLLNRFNANSAPLLTPLMGF